MSRQIDASRAADAIEDLGELALIRHAHDPLLSRIWGLRRNLTAYDAAYVALAEALDASVVTCDRKRLAGGHDADVDVIQ